MPRAPVPATVAPSRLGTGILGETVPGAPRPGLHASGRYIVDKNTGAMFPLRAAAGWLLFTDFTLTEAAQWLDSHKSHGFNAVIIKLISKRQTNTPNDISNNAPFTGTAFTSSLNEPYWANVNSVMKMISARRMVALISILYIGFNEDTVDGWYPEATSAGASAVTSYCQAAVARLAPFPNVIWIVGGDDTPADGTVVVDAVRAGIAGSGRLTTAHWAENNLSNDHFPTWDLNLVYRWGGHPYENARTGYAANTGAVGGIEMLYQNNTGAGATVPIVCEQIWAFMLEAIGGVTVGNEWTWKADTPFGPGQSQLPNGHHWYEYLDQEYALFMGVFAAVQDSIPWSTLVPSTGATFITSARGTFGSVGGYVTAACNDAGGAGTASCGVVYTPAGASITVAMSRFSSTVTARRIDPTNGATTALGTFAASGTQAFTTPGNNAGGFAAWAFVFTS